MKKPCVKLLLLALVVVGAAESLFAQRSYPPEIDDATVEVYKTVGDVELKVWMFTPEKHKPQNPVPAIVFYFGGGWNGGSPKQFEEQAKHLAGRGMVAILVDYRVRSRQGVQVHSCVSDAKSAIRWVRSNANRLGVDPNRIVSSGGSAGGHLAASVAILPDYDEPDEDHSVSSVPNAAALFNPALVLAPVPGLQSIPEERMNSLRQRMGVEPETLSPFHNLRKGVVPTIIFHGTDDKTVPFASAEAFHKKMKKLGNPCELVAYKGAGHGFFNHGGSKNIYFTDTLMRLDAFLVSLGYLSALPEVEHLK